MKRGIILLTLLILLISPVILAAEDDMITSTDKNNSIVPADTKLKEQLNTLRGGLDEKTDNVLEKKIQIPNLLQVPVRIVFGIKDAHTITKEQFIVLLTVWIMFFFLIQGVLKLTPFLDKGWQNILGSIIITMLIALTGTMNILVAFFFSLEEMFEWLETMGSFKILIAIGIVVIIVAIINYLTNWIKRNLLLEKAEKVGENINMMAKMGKASKENI